MSTYFVDPYTGYYDKLSNNQNIISESNNVVESLNVTKQVVDDLNNSLNTAIWKELGYNDLVSNIMPGLSSSIQSLIDFSIDGLSAVCAILINDLLPLLEKLQEEDKNYEYYYTKLNNLTSQQKYDTNGNKTNNYYFLENKCLLSKNLCESIQEDIKDLINNIKELDNNAKQYDSESISSDAFVVSNSNLDSLILVNYNGNNYYVVNTKISVLDYSEYVQKNKMYQNAGALNGQCMIASQIYARDLLTGTYSSKSDFVNMKGSPATRINERVRSQDKDDVLKYVFDEVREGHPVVLQVTQKRSNEGLRHLVTVVGFKEEVTSYSDLTPENILVLDNVDGKIQTLSERNRSLYNQGGKGFQALGPTDVFLAKEVNMETLNA